jgi:outer membrane lipoprotein-sorting protein
MASARGLARRRVWLDRDTLRLVRSRSYDDAGDLVMEATFGEWKEGAPRQVMVARPREGYEAAFSLDKVERNVAAPERAFVPRTPEGFTVVEVDRP